MLLASVVLLLAPQAGPDPRVVQHVRQGLAAREANRLDDAARDFESAAKLAPNIPEIHLNLGLVHHRRADYQSAIDSLEQALRLKPALTGVRDLLGFDYLMTGAPDAARANLDKALAENPKNVDSHMWLGLVEIERAEYRAAAEHLEIARQARPKDADILFYLGRAYDRLAAQARNDLLATAPDSARAHMAAAEFAAFNGRPKEAIAEYEQATAADPKLPGVNAAIGELLADSGDFTQAAASYEAEMKLAGQNSRTRYRYGLVLAQLGRSKEAIPYLEQAVAANPGLVDAQLQLGKALVQSGKIDRAEKPLLAVVSGEASDELKSTAYYQLAILYRKQNRAAEAARYIKLFEEKKPRK